MPKESIKFVPYGSILSVHYIDVGQGDSEFLELPNGETMLIDACPQSASDTVVNYISDLGYTSINYVIATHPHEDHIGGIPAVFEAFDVQSIYMPNATNNTKIFGRLLDAIEAEGIQITETVAGMDIVSFEDFEIISLAPSGGEQSNLNNYSIVLKATFGNRDFLFLADAEHEEIEEITGDMQADVLKVGHHGSDTSTSVYLLDAVQPQFAIISCGEGNSYGLPHQQTLDLLSRFSCEAFLFFL